MRQAVAGLVWVGLSTIALGYTDHILGIDRTYAQVIPDSTLGTTVQTLNNLDFTIDGGTRSGNNLFHSFNQFSAPTGGSALFNNATDIQTIFARVTGGSASNIDGLLKANSTANLFLLNPRGILFGANARLNIGGSFVGTTANSIHFADGTEFSTVDPISPPLLTMSAPIGLQFGRPSGNIALQGTGHRLTAQDSLLTPYIPTVLEGSLAVKPGRTLALIGSAIDLNDGILRAPGGRVELGGVAEGEVKLNPLNQGFALDYGQVAALGDVQLAGRSLVEVNGINAGSIQVQGRTVSLTDGSTLWAQNRGSQKAGDINVFASDRVQLSGTTSNLKIRTSIINETIGSGMSGDINIATPDLSLMQGATIGNRTYSAANSGAVNVTTTRLNINGYIPSDFSAFTALGSLTFSTGKAGDVQVKTRDLSIVDGGFLGSTTFARGAGGNITIDADHVNVSGTTPIGNTSLIASTTNGRNGNSGNLLLNTRTLILRESGTITTASLGIGNAGELTVNATESIELSTKSPLVSYGSAIAASVSPLPAAYTSQLSGGNVMPIMGSSGEVTVNTPLLRISDNGRINASNYGIGNAGALNINTEKLELRNTGSLFSFTASGQGGNINVQTNSLILRDQSWIVTTALGSGDGGNITIQAPIILGLNNSDIIASAVTGRGGNINITTQGIFGLKFRPELTEGNDITASSQLGVNGTVEINNFGVNPNSGLVVLPENIINSSQQVASGCSNNTGSSFVVTGRGGMPQNPTREVNHDRTWNDIRDLSAFHKPAIAPTPTSTIVEATTWYRHPQTGKVELVATRSTEPRIPATCAPAQLHSSAN
ncbi:S-layer family protein [Leptolyngbya boryana CZ1]|uniref:S-layer family protein n=1 Tax=Leptolyngbya boryana CZ1 TaxID=3060204 RepID=A0AA96WPZ9_LEPBY|nr:S-layer family protein [Leptolyngbya boryana]WNZ43682.1 S-layer family protein [Leptolyngbya boryana CZ1]